VGVDEEAADPGLAVNVDVFVTVFPLEVAEYGGPAGIFGADAPGSAYGPGFPLEEIGGGAHVGRNGPVAADGIHQNDQQHGHAFGI